MAKRVRNEENGDIDEIRLVNNLQALLHSSRKRILLDKEAADELRQLINGQYTKLFEITPESEDSSIFAQLPEEIIEKIFDFALTSFEGNLSTIPLVCKKWRRIFLGLPRVHFYSYCSTAFGPHKSILGYLCSLTEKRVFSYFQFYMYVPWKEEYGILKHRWNGSALYWVEAYRQKTPFKIEAAITKVAREVVDVARHRGVSEILGDTSTILRKAEILLHEWHANKPTLPPSMAQYGKPAFFIRLLKKNEVNLLRLNVDNEDTNRSAESKINKK
jgi:hypothetical protein